MTNKKSESLASVIIPTLNRGNILVNTLKDLLSQKYPNFEIIIVDQSNIMDKKITKIVLANAQKIKYFTLKAPGTSYAKNFGASKAQGEIFIFIDDDVHIEDRNFILNHVLNYENSKIGGVGGRVIMDSSRPVKDIKDVGKFKFCGLKEINNFNADFRTFIDHVYGCNQSFRKNVFDKVGGFSVLYKGNAYLEEADLSFRVKRSGFLIVFDPKAVLLHLHYQSGGCRTSDIYELRYWLVHNYTFFYLRYFPHILFPVYFLKQFIWALTSGIKRRDIKMVQNMLLALINGYKFYQDIKRTNKKDIQKIKGVTKCV